MKHTVPRTLWQWQDLPELTIQTRLCTTGHLHVPHQLLILTAVSNIQDTNHVGCKSYIDFYLIWCCLCSPGYYCPLKTEYAYQFACPQGTFNNLTHRTVLDDCQACSGGYYCDQEGLEEPVAQCTPGKHWLVNSSHVTVTDWQTIVLRLSNACSLLICLIKVMILPGMLRRVLLWPRGAGGTCRTVHTR